MNKENKMGTMPVGRLLITMSLPMIISMLVQALYNVVDSIFVARYSEAALSAVSYAFPAQNLMIGLSTGIGVGMNALLSKSLGEKNAKMVKKAAENGIFLSLIGFLLFLVFGLFGSGWFIGFQTKTAEIIENGRIYLTICCCASFGIFGEIIFERLMQSTGRTIFTLYTQGVGAVINIILDPIFIFVFHMGVSGAALATVISQAVSALWVLRFLTGKRAILRLRREQIRIDIGRTKRIMTLGLPGFVMQGTNSLVQIVCNTQLQAQGGDLYVGVMTVIGSVREMLSLPVSGISSGAQPVLGYNYGAARYERVREGIRFMSVLGVAYTALAWVVVMLIPGPLLSMFGCEPETIEIGAEMMNIYFFGFVFMAFQFVGQSTFQGLGKAKQAIFFSLFRKAMIVVPLTLLLPVFFDVRGVFLAEPISNAIGGLACFITMWLTLYKRLPAEEKLSQ